MHLNPAFRSAPTGQHLAFARERAFGVLVSGGPDGPLAAHIPFVVSEDGGLVEAHLMRSNPLARHIAGGAEALLIVSGADGYVSPDWYGVEDQVPTWNYVAVHLRGEARTLPEASLRGHLERLSRSLEERFRDKHPWTPDKLAPQTAARLMRMIVPLEMTVRHVDGTWKLNQNKASATRLSAADAIEASPVGLETAMLAGLMRRTAD
jgi:transcriptional regulator